MGEMIFYSRNCGGFDGKVFEKNGIRGFNKYVQW